MIGAGWSIRRAGRRGDGDQGVDCVRMSGLDETVFAGRYRAVRRLGSGGTATVFLARDVRLEREVAVKRVHGAEVTAATARRLWREARIMASLRHPNLVPVYDMVMDDDDLLLVMEYVRGETLADVLASAPLDWESTVALLDPVAAALDYVHGRGVVHRDLKPSNILVGAGGVVKVADLGLATAAEITKITPPGAILGTPAYMAPEQARPGAITPAADVYALATMIFEALGGSPPRRGRTVVAILAQATQEPPADLREHRPETPAAVAEALMRAMSPTPEERQGSASQLLRELAAGFDAGPAEDTAAPQLRFNGGRSSPLLPERSSKPAEQAPGRRPAAGNRRARVLAIGALAVATAAVLGLVTLLANQQSSRPQPAPPSSRAQATPHSEPARTPTASAARSATPTAEGPQTLSAAATVRAFYRRAAAGDYARAWALAGPGMRRAFGNSLQRFSRDLSSLRRIHFKRVAIVARDDTGVVVEIQSVATHDDRVDRCTGTLRTIRGNAGGWLVEPAGVRCTSN